MSINESSLTSNFLFQLGTMLFHEIGENLADGSPPSTSFGPFEGDSSKERPRFFRDVYCGRHAVAGFRRSISSLCHHPSICSSDDLMIHQIHFCVQMFWGQGRVAYAPTFALERTRLLNTYVLSDYIAQTNPAPNPLVHPCGLDTLHLAVSQTVPFTRHFESLRKQLARTGRKEDYRPLGLPLVMPNPLYDRKASRILQLIGVGQMDRAGIIEILQKVVEWQPLDLRVYRVDLTADWIGSTLEDCRRSVRVQRKRNSTQFSNPNRTAEYLEAQRHESGRYETLYFGSTKSNDYLRVYDKEAQLRSTGKTAPGVIVPSPWVRFERVLAGDKIPAELKTLGALLQNGSAYNPFADVEVSAAYDVSQERIYEWNGPLNHRMNAAWTLYMIQTYGRFEAARRIREEQRKPKELFDLLDRIVADLAIEMPTPADLTARFQASFQRQLFGDPKAELPATMFDELPAITITTQQGNLPQSHATHVLGEP